MKGSMDYSARLKLSPINPGHTQPHNTILNKLSTLHTVVHTLVTIDSSKGICGIVIVCIAKVLIHPPNCKLRLLLCKVKTLLLISDIVRMVTSRVSEQLPQCSGG